MTTVRTVRVLRRLHSSRRFARVADSSRAASLAVLAGLSALSALSAVACGGAAPESAKTPAAESDKGFADYAATHGIQSLSTSEETPEASADGLRLERVDKEKPVKLDGVVDEWPALVKAGLVVKGSEPKSTLKIGLQYDDAKLYVGAEIADASFAAGQDHVSLVLAVPTPGGSYASYDIGLYAGKPGETAGSVRFAAGGRGAVPGAKIVEAPVDGGYAFEATIPLGAVPEMRSTRVGIHGVARYVDGGDVIATGPGDGQHPQAMAWVPSEPELALIEQLLTPKGLAKTAPVAEVVADLTGDGIRERVAVYEHYLTICGPAYLGGTAFFYRDLVGELVKLDVRDVSGRGKPDVVVRRKMSVGDGTREYLEVLTALSDGAEPQLTFAHEVEVRQSEHHVDDAVRLGRGEIDVSVEPASQWDAQSYSEPTATDVEPILLPWGAVRSQTWRWDGTHFAKAKEIAQRETGGGAHAVATRSDDDSPRTLRPAEPPTPKVVRRERKGGRGEARGGDASAQVLAQFRKDRGIGEATPKVELQVQVTGDARPERVALIGRDIVVFGPGFKGGTGYEYITLTQFADASDVKDLSARDLTGDGDADLVVRGVRHPTGEGAQVDSELMFVYSVKEDAITRLFAIETAREQGSKRVQGLVQLVPGAGGKTFDVLAAPGRASGWSEKTYPWSQETPGSGNVEPLLLPWGGIRSVRYTWNGTQFVRSDG